MVQLEKKTLMCSVNMRDDGRRIWFFLARQYDVWMKKYAFDAYGFRFDQNRKSP